MTSSDMARPSFFRLGTTPIMIRAAIQKGKHNNSPKSKRVFPPAYIGAIAPVAWKGLKLSKDKSKTAPGELEHPATAVAMITQ